MAAVPENLIESELFGHVAGAFTGSTGKRIGRFEAAHGGSLFIDEIGDLAFECQAKLLRVLENHCFTPVGGNDNRSPDVRVIAATNRCLEQMIQERTFRSELYYRLNVIAIALPPLRERCEDIPLLVRHFLDELSQAYNRPSPAVDDKLMNFLNFHPWPGNVRQLRNCVESMFVLSDSPIITMNDLPKHLHSEKRPDSPFIDVPEGYTLEDVERTVVYQMLDRCHGNRTHAAKRLGISVRTLQRRLKIWANNSKLSRNEIPAT
jgi:transcriptional regulator with PAS, ATPase and Fis domain